MIIKKTFDDVVMLSKLDRTKSPCEDFYEFSCGGLIKSHNKPPPSRSKWGLETEMDLKLSEMIREVISVLPHQTRTNTLTWKIKNFYDSCMSLDNIETDNERPLRKIINELGGWNVLRNFQVLSWEFSKTLVNLHNEYGVKPFFSISTIADPRNASKNILFLTPSGLGLPDKSYYYREKQDRMSLSYIRYMKDVARQLGATSIDANSFSEDMFYFERRIAEATPSNEELENVFNHEIHTINDLKMSAPSVPLHEILDAMFHKENINSDTEILLTSAKYLTKISNIIATTDRSALNNYVIWNLVKEYLPYLSQNFQDIYSVYVREMTGATNLLERWEFCIKTLQKFMDAGLAAQIENSSFRTDSDKNNEIIGQIFKTVRQTIRESITKAKWVDLELYKHFISKLNGTTIQIGFPNDYLDSSRLEEYYSKLYVQKNNFFQNILYGVSFLQENNRRSYVNPKSEYRWLSLVSSESKVEFVPSENKIIIPQKLLNKPYYEPEYPIPVLYGTFGVEISKALVSSLFMYSGLYSYNGSLINTQSLVANLSMVSIDHQLKCLIDLQINNNIETDFEKSNRTILKTFTEISAVKQAFKSMKKSTSDVEHIHQAGLEDFDDESLFYIAYGQSLFNVKTVQEIDKQNTTGNSLDGRKL
ncbi:endothelin-converting enzyme, putative [Pediculus humanus corporis]|uniref:Endothelin-converting enzyme, putative n=1 Tax=Pediculus humanus subsp. corporis TaxID=121224 RepID=E0VZ32_PEDHC|nr:endothelin-converting enzyme, putative [Pediculus humanus corporis]EEB18638.1 endothelin-converting enzyme, putative [Pediculus humanus corporis]